MTAPTILTATLTKLMMLRQGLWLLSAEIEGHALAVMMALATAVCTLPAIAVPREELLLVLWIAAQVATAGTLAGMIGRLRCRPVGKRWAIRTAVLFDLPVLALSLVHLISLAPPYLIFYGEIPRLLSFLFTLVYLRDLAEGAQEARAAELLLQVQMGVYWQFLIWPGMIIATVGACFLAIALFCVVAPLIPLALGGAGVVMFAKMVIRYSRAVHILQLAVTERLKALDESHPDHPTA